ncbi:MAG: F0F1 ATP synthase subunit epsilon [Magnetovibrio sp.]|nr:F0F1 ATP synthase subunit epsilon [Magnetovibrio sp.]
MADVVEFELVSPQRLVKSQAVSMVVVPCSEGDIGVLPGHTPLIGTVRPGVVDIHDNGKVTESIFVSGGFVEVTPDRCTLLAEEATMVGDLKQDEAQARLEAAEKALEKASSDIEKANAEAEIKTAEAMLSAMGASVAAH